MKRIALISLIMIALLLTTMAGLSPKTEPATAVGSEIIEARTLNSKVYYNGNWQYTLYNSKGAVHYLDGSEWLEINNALVPAVAPWDYQMATAPYHIQVKEDITAGQVIEFERDSHYLYLQPMALEYSNDMGQIQPVSIPSEVAALVTNTPYELLPGQNNNIGKIKWENAYGSGIDFEWSTLPSRLNKILTISDFDNLPPVEQYIINGGNAFLRLNLIFDPDDDLDIYIDNILWTRDTNRQTFEAIEFKYNNETLFGFMPLKYWDSSQYGEEEHSIATLEKSGNKLYISVRVPYEWLQTAVYPVYIDADVEVYIAASTDDCELRYNGAAWGNWSTALTSIMVGYSSSSHQRRGGGFRFQSIGIGNGDTIDSANMTFVAAGSNVQTVVNSRFTGEDVDDAATFSTQADYQARRGTVVGGANDDYITTAQVDWDGMAAWSSASSYTSPDISTIIQEIVNRGGWASGQDMVIFWDDHDNRSDTDNNHVRNASSWDHLTNAAPFLSVDFTAGGASAPTVVTGNATSVEETTATLQGNITATGGANATERGFEWDIDSGVPYSTNWTEAGNFGTGNFSHGIAGLTRGELYYYRASANNSGGWGYGAEVTFLTKPDPASSFNSTDNGTNWLTWGWINGTGMDYVELRYLSGGSAPADNTSGTLGYWGNGTSANVTGLSASTTYTARIFTHATEGGLWSTADSNPTAQGVTDAAPVSAPTVVTGNATGISYTYATGQGNITATGGGNATLRGFQYGIGDFADNVTEAGDYGTGNFSLLMSSLVDNTEYQYRAFATNAGGTGYGASVNFTTLDILAPTVVTGNATSVLYTTADGQGNITVLVGANATSRGFQYGIGDFADNVTEAGDYGTGNFSLEMSGLTDNTEYQYRAFAINPGGIGYGASVNFTTLDILAPTVVTNAASGIGDVLATLSGNITATGGQNASSRGFQWGNSCANLSANWTEGGSFGVGIFTHEISGLSANTTYYFRALAANVGGTGFGSCANFTTAVEALPVPDAPTTFTLVDLGGIAIGANWSASVNATGYTIWVSRTAFPDATTGFEIAYSSNNSALLSANLTGYDLSINTYYFSLRAYSANGYSNDYITASIGGNDMADLASALTGFTTAFSLFGRGIVLLLPLVLLSYLAFNFKKPLLFIILMPVAMFSGLYWYDAYTTPVGLAISLALIIYSFVSFAFAMGALFKKEDVLLEEE